MLSFKIALQFIKKSWKQSLVIVFAVFVGVGVQFFIANLSVILENLILEQATMYQEHIIIKAEESVSSYDNLDFTITENIMNEIDEVTYALYFSQNFGHLTKENGEKYVFQIHIADYNNDISDYQHFQGLIEENIVEGRVNDPSKDEILLDDYFAKNNNVKIGEIVTFETVYIKKSFEVVGTFDLGVYKSTRNFSFISHSLIDSTIRGAYRIFLQVDNVSESKEVARKVQTLLGDDYEVTSWEERFPEINLLDLAQKAVVSVIQILIAIAVFAIILSILGFLIQQKNQQVGILKAMGIHDYIVRRVFIIMTSLLAITGTILGLFGGTLTMHLYQRYMTYPTGEPRFNFELSPISYIVSSTLVILSVAIATISAIRKVKRSKVIDLLKI